MSNSPKNRKQRSVAIQSTEFFNPELETRPQPPRLCKKAGFRNLLQKSVIVESQISVERTGSLSLLEGQRSKSVQATFDDVYSIWRSKFRTPSLETISLQRRHQVGREEKEDDFSRKDSEAVRVLDGSSSAKPGTSRMPSTALSSVTQLSNTFLRPNEGSVAVVYSSAEKGIESSRSSNIAFLFGSQGSRRFSDETTILIQDYQSYDLINAAGRQDADFLRQSVPACCVKNKSSTEFANRPITFSLEEMQEDENQIFCRICHEGEEVEELIQPCLCKGSVGYLHASCLKTWLEQSSTSRCELCNYPYAILQTRKYTKGYSVKVFFKTVVDRRTMIYDIMTFVIITPLTLVGVAMCIQASLFSSLGNPMESGFKMGNITKAGLIMLSATIIVAYSIWIYTLISFYYKAWKKWYENCYDVEVLPVKLSSEERLEAARRLSEELNRRQFSREQDSAFSSFARNSQSVNFDRTPVPVATVF